MQREIIFVRLLVRTEGTLQRTIVEGFRPPPRLVSHFLRRDGNDAIDLPEDLEEMSDGDRADAFEQAYVAWCKAADAAREGDDDGDWTLRRLETGGAPETSCWDPEEGEWVAPPHDPCATFEILRDGEPTFAPLKAEPEYRCRLMLHVSTSSR